jgi:ankyrin repeat protein
MPFMERLQSALILKTPMYHPNEAHIIEHIHEIFYETIVHNQSVQMVQMIIEGFDVDFHELQDRDGNTPLHFALKFKHYELMTTLLHYGGDVTLTNNEGVSAFDSAAKEEKTLISNVVSLVDTKAHNLFETARLGDLNRLVHSVRKQKQLFQTNREGQSLLHLAILSNNIKAVLYLLNKGLDIDAEDNDALTPLIIAMSHPRYLNVGILLLNRHATVEHISNNGHSALSVAIRNNNPEGAIMLIKRGANINIADNAHTPLTLTHTALLQYHENAQTYRELETAKVDVTLNSLGWTPLCTTVTKVQDKPNSEHIRLLLQLGADVNHIDINGRTPLMLAASMGRLSSVEMLMNNYAANDAFDNFGWSALMFGVYYNHIDVVTYMLDSGVNPNQVSPQGLTALKIAQEHKRIKMVDLLLEYGAMATKEDS